MIFDIRIILYSARRIAIAEESPSLTTAKVESAKDILLKIIDLHPIAKLNGAADLCPSTSRVRIATIILKAIILSSRCAIDCCAIHCVVQSRWLVVSQHICGNVLWRRTTAAYPKQEAENLWGPRSEYSTRRAATTSCRIMPHIRTLVTVGLPEVA